MLIFLIIIIVILFILLIVSTYRTRSISSTEINKESDIHEYHSDENEDRNYIPIEPITI